MNVFLVYLAGFLTGAVFTYGMLATQRKPPEVPITPLAIREAEQIVAQLL